jgi:predicted  nucleic acid-binding Zn-ribbon protein
MGAENMNNFDLNKITGNEPPLITEDDRDAKIERLERDLSVALEELDEEYRVAGKFMEEIERLRDEEVRLTREVGKLRLLLRDARDDVDEIAGQQTKRHRIEEYREQLAEIDAALEEDTGKIVTPPQNAA